MRILSVIICFVFPLALFGQASSPEDLNHAFERLTNDEIVIGGSAGVIISGEVVWSETIGYSEVKSGTPFKDETVVRTASIAKPMTAVAVLQLFEKGLVGLDDPIQKYLPEFPEKPEGTITIRHLLHHNSGIKHYKNGKEIESRENYPTLSDAMNVFKDRKLAGIPGEVFVYSSYGYVVLGRIIEVVSGLDYETYMKTNIWDVCGMENTGVETFGQPAKEQTTFYHRSGNGKVKAVKKVNNLSNRIPAGGFYSTTTDILKFGHGVVSHKLISAESLKLMMEAPEVTNDGNPYGMGWYLYGPNPKYGFVLGHSGGQTGTSSQLMIFPEREAAIVVMTNTSGTWNEVVRTSVELFPALDIFRNTP